ncbi:MAG: hypothetical protein OJI74_01940, partial [Rhodanobacter thiooxydans]|nr:hypothetical protein [Rhodanobacter thiooxydans]
MDELFVRQNCLEQFWTAAGWPWSAQRGRVNPMDGIHNPARHAAVSSIKVESRKGRFAYLAERGGGRTLR